MFEKETPETVRQLWLSFHYNKPSCVAWTLTKEQYESISKRMKQHPNFILPLTSEADSVVMLVQCQGKQVLITSVDEFRTLGPDAPAALVLTLYDDLVHTKETCLMRAEILNQASVMKADAERLLTTLLMFYEFDADYEAYVRVFNATPAKFDLEGFLAMCRSRARKVA